MKKEIKNTFYNDGIVLPKDIVFTNEIHSKGMNKIIVELPLKEGKIPVLTKSKSKWIKNNTKVVFTKPICTLTILPESNQDK